MHERLIPSDRLLAALVGLLCLAVYLSVGGYHFTSVDEVASFVVTRSLASRGAYDADVLAWLRPLMAQSTVVLAGQGGHMYALKDVGPSALAVPLAWLAHASGWFSPVRAAFLLMPLATALTAALVMATLRAWGYPPTTAIAGALTFGLASLALPYSRTLFTQPVTALGLALAAWAALRVIQTGDSRQAALAGVGMGIAGISSAPVWVVALAYLAAWLAPALSSGERSSGAVRRVVLRLWLPFAGGAFCFAAAQLLYNLGRFGSLLDTGHVEVGGADIRLAYGGVGGFGLLFSTPRGVIWYSPFVVLAPFGLWIALRQGRRSFALLMAAQAALVAAIYSAFFLWWGGQGFGPRFLVPIMPGLAVLTAPLLDRLRRPSPAWLRLAVGVVLAVSLLTEVAASLLAPGSTDDGMYQQLLTITPPSGLLPTAPVLFDPAYIVQRRLIALAAQPVWDVVWMSRRSVDLPVVAGALALVGLAAGCLTWALRWPSPVLKWSPAVLGALAVAFAGLTLARYPRSSGYSVVEAPLVSGLTEAASTVTRLAAPGDRLIVLLYPPDAFAWIEQTPGLIPDTGLTIEQPLRPETEDRLKALSATDGRVWLVAKDTPAAFPHNGVERWLAERGFAGTDASIPGWRIVAYTLEAHPGTLVASQAVFGGQIALTAYGDDVAGGAARWVNVQLQWSASGPIARNYVVFVHLQDGEGRLVAQHDGWPVAGYAPTSTWTAGEMISDHHSVALPGDLPPGRYRLVVGLYDAADGARLTLGPGAGDALTLGEIDLR